MTDGDLPSLVIAIGIFSGPDQLLRIASLRRETQARQIRRRDPPEPGRAAGSAFGSVQSHRRMTARRGRAG